MAIRYTKQQKASPYFQQYKKERVRLQRFASSAKARGIELPTDFIPKVPQKITEGSVRKLQRITPEHGYYEKATFRAVNKFTGEVIESKRGSATAINRAIARFKESIREALEPTEPLSKRRMQQITESFSKPDVFSTARHKSMLRQVENRNTKESLRELAEKLSESSSEEASYTEDTPSIDMPGPPEGSDITNYDFYADSEDLPESAIEQYSTFTEYEPDYSETDSDFDEAFDSDYRSEKDRINWQAQFDRVNDYIDNCIGYIGHNVSPHMADAIDEMVSQFRSAVSDKAWAELMDDENFWTDISSMVEEYYKSRKDPMPEVYNRISSRLAGRPMTMEENSRYDEYAEEDDSDSYDY